MTKQDMGFTEEEFKRLVSGCKPGQPRLWVLGVGGLKACPGPGTSGDEE